MLTLKTIELPEDLLHLVHPVEQLHIVGDSFDSLMGRPRLAIVGSRKITPYGRGVTEKLSAELGKLVFAVPGNITNPLSAGCNNLI